MTKIYKPKNYLGEDLLTKEEAVQNYAAIEKELAEKATKDELSQEVEKINEDKATKEELQEEVSRIDEELGTKATKEELSEEIESVNTKIDEHTAKSDIHTNTEEKDKWSDKYTKQEVDDKLTLKTDVKTTEALETRVETLENAIPEGQRVDVLKEEVNKLAQKVDGKAEQTELKGHVDNTGIHFDEGQKKAITDDITKLKSDVKTHTENNDIHVELAKKTEWDNKADQSDIESAIETLHGQVTSEIGDKATELTGTFNSQIGTINSTLTELEESKASNDELTKQIGEVDKKLETKATKEDLEKEKAALTEKINAAATKVELEEKTSTLEQSIESLETSKASNDDLDSKIGEVNSKLEEKATQEELNQKESTLNEKITALESSRATTQALNEAVTKIETERATKDELSKKEKELQDKIDEKAAQSALAELSGSVEELKTSSATKDELSDLQSDVNKRVIQELEGTKQGDKAKIQNQTDGAVIQYVGADESNSAVTVNDYTGNVGAEICSLDSTGRGARIIVNHDGAYYSVGDAVSIQDEDKIATAKDLKDKVTQTELTQKETELTSQITTKTGEISTTVSGIETRVKSLEDVRPEDTYSETSQHAQSGKAVASGINEGLTKKVVSQPNENLKEIVLKKTEDTQTEKDEKFANATINGTIHDFSGHLHTIKIKGPDSGEVGPALFLSVWQGTTNSYSLVAKSLNAAKSVPGGEMTWYFNYELLENNKNVKLIPYEETKEGELRYDSKFVDLNCRAITRANNDNISWFDHATVQPVTLAASLNPLADIPDATFVLIKEGVGSVLQNDFSVKTLLKETAERLNALEAALAIQKLGGGCDVHSVS